ncbi:3-deoxy-D-manno-octulosonic acid transferase [Phenylobacterium sp. Root700]|uniref:3-deoxy-D-manno-octulosonic acid transferase n=1 Tax=Phenylobacterium sp. Root700 TaxID=1736591 RepID=UPI00070180BC|nr:3-deoxy-D-manno-octulosonic acid transferase [Phenylobacterium sp. Root700]KRB52854.1 3-deoxy-D-manno-octulosonic acid transferase [Phenylobacterium sp. Root700]
MRPLSLALYAAATRLAEPLAPGLLARRAARGKEDPARVGERLGHASAPRPPGPLVWLHGVSVGESLSLLPLAQALAAPGRTLLVTSGTRTSAELLATRLPPGVIHQYAPVDTPASVRRFLNHWRPDASVLVESELWPNLILAAKARGVKLALVSARMTQASADGWARAPGAARALLSAFDLILPQEAQTDARLTKLGATTGPRLNLKLVGEALPFDAAELAKLKTAIGPRKVVLAASTHPGEDEIVASAFRAAQTGALLIIAPRHPDRGEAVASLLASQGFNTARRGAEQSPTPDTQAYVADTLGEMGLFFRVADVAVMGGSYVPCVGGHNPLEPARLGVAIVTGPHAFNAAAIYAEMFIEVAALETPDAATLTRDLRGLLNQPLVARRIGQAALTYAERQGAALDEALALLKPLLPA